MLETSAGCQSRFHLSQNKSASWQNVDELMALCDNLETRFSATKGTHAAFASAAVHHLDA